MLADLAKNTLFNRYNRKKDLVRCPYGRSKVRSQLDAYVKGAVSLYGAVSCEDLVNLFNQQHEDQTDPEELYILLLPLVHKNADYGFYKGHLVHPLFLLNLASVDDLIQVKASKPLYVPEKEELLAYAFTDLKANDAWLDVFSHMAKAFGFSSKTTAAFCDLRDYISYDHGISKLGPIMEAYGLAFTFDEFEEFLKLLMQAKNNTRLWENNGHTPSELHHMMLEASEREPAFFSAESQKVGRNEPCPCGSGKKYKRCCARLMASKSAHLKYEEQALFYDIWFNLITYINAKMAIVEQVSDALGLYEEETYKVREVLWENPDLIEDYIRDTALPQETVDILRSWKNQHIKGFFIVLNYGPDHTLLLNDRAKGDKKLYAVKGISEPLASVLMASLPTAVETVLLPFKGQIIYDTYLNRWSVGFGDGMRALFQEMYQEALEDGVVTHLA